MMVPATVRAIPGQKVHPARIPGPTGLGLGSLEIPVIDAKIIAANGPEPRTRIANPIQSSRETRVVASAED